MRVISKIFSILFVLSVLLVLFAPSIKASCHHNSYGDCVGTCSCPSGTTGTCTCNESSGICAADTSQCKAPTNPPQPTNTPASQNCNWIGYTCVGSCAAGYSCTAVGSYTCACVANTQPTSTPNTNHLCNDRV